MISKTRFLTLSLATIITAAIPGANIQAQKAPQRIYFARGATVARVSGRFRGAGEEVLFVLRARAGQHMRVEIIGRGPTRGIITFPSGAEDGAPGGVIFDDDLTETGDYRIRVTENMMANARRGSFVLKVEILSPRQSGSTSNLTRYVGKYPSALLKGEPGLKARLRDLLGANYPSFAARLQTETPIERDGDVIIARGCMAHECTVEEAILAVDLSSGKPYVAIKSNRHGGGFKIYAEDKDRIPEALRRAMQQ